MREFSVTDCPGCSARPGETHRDKCHVEICSVCGKNKWRCQHAEHDKEFARWTGIIPLMAESIYLDMGMGELLKSPVSRYFLVKPNQWRDQKERLRRPRKSNVG